MLSPQVRNDFACCVWWATLLRFFSLCLDIFRSFFISWKQTKNKENEVKFIWREPARQRADWVAGRRVSVYLLSQVTQSIWDLRQWSRGGFELATIETDWKYAFITAPIQLSWLLTRKMWINVRQHVAQASAALCIDELNLIESKHDWWLVKQQIWIMTLAWRQSISLSSKLRCMLSFLVTEWTNWLAIPMLVLLFSNNNNISRFFDHRMEVCHWPAHHTRYKVHLGYHLLCIRSVADFVSIWARSTYFVGFAVVSSKREKQNRWQRAEWLSMHVRRSFAKRTTNESKWREVIVLNYSAPIVMGFEWSCWTDNVGKWAPHRTVAYLVGCYRYFFVNVIYIDL